MLGPDLPDDTYDAMVRVEVETTFMADVMKRAQFVCSRCGEEYWREVQAKMVYDEIVEVEGVHAPGGQAAQYALNPTIKYVWAPYPHVCLDRITVW